MDHKGHAEKYAGQHEIETSMAAIIFLVIPIQLCLLLWKEWRHYSYEVYTLIGMLIIPLVLSIKNHWWWQFLGIWLVFSSITSLIAKRATEKLEQGTTPRMVSKWLMLTCKVSSCSRIFGYITMMATILFDCLNVISTPSDLWLMCWQLLIHVQLEQVKYLQKDLKAT